MLSVRGPISDPARQRDRRHRLRFAGDCGPGLETAAPLTEAGLVLVPLEHSNNFGPALGVLDPSFRAQLAKRSREAYARYFSWDVIASQFAEAMRECESKPESRAKRRR
jgi:hypothetical protein